MVSASTMTPPRLARRPATVDFPAPIPPVRPTSSTRLSDLGCSRRIGRRIRSPNRVRLDGLGENGSAFVAGGDSTGLLEVLGPGRLGLRLGHELGVVGRAD